MGELLVGLAQYFSFYTAEHPHQSSDHQTPDQVYSADGGSGVLSIDRSGSDIDEPQENFNTGLRRSADAAELGTA